MASLSIQESSFRFRLGKMTLVAGWVTSFFMGPSSVIGQESPAYKPTNHSIQTREFFYEKAPYPSCHASTIEETPTGLVAAWFGGTHEKNPDVGIWFSRREGAGWSEGIEVADGIQSRSADGEVFRYPCWNPVLQQVPKGPLYLFYKVGPTPADWWGMVTSSTDGGKTWEVPRRLPEGILGPVKNKGIWLESGELLAPTSTELGGPWRVYFELSKPPFSQWVRTAQLATGDGKGGIQPSLLKHSDGSLQALSRCDKSSTKILECWSKDGGKHWTDLAPTPLPNPNSGIDAVTLQDGRHLLVYNHTTRSGSGSPIAREMLNIAISRDGKEWLACEVLENEKKGEFSYPAVIQSSDGMVHVTYTWNRKKVSHVVMDPRKLIGKPIIDGVWPPL